MRIRNEMKSIFSIFLNSIRLELVFDAYQSDLRIELISILSNKLLFWLIPKNRRMNKQNTFQRKSTFTSSNPSENNSRFQFKSPSTRISLLKSLSVKEIPFSKHIYGQQELPCRDVGSAIVFHSQKWTLEPKIMGAEQNFSAQKNNLKGRNPFLQARKACVQKSKSPVTNIKSKNEKMNIDYGFDDDIITLRSVKSTGKLQDYDQIQGIK